MAKNPMQRKAQNSFLLGMLITLLITGLVIAFLVLQLTKLTKDQQKAKSLLKTVYVVSQDIESGEPITSDKLIEKTVDGSTIPANALTTTDLDEKTDILDENGNLIKKVEVVSKIKLMQGTVLTSEMITETGELAADLRKQEYNMFVIPSQLTTGQYVDVRLRLPNGKDYIVVSHKRITIPDYEGTLSVNTVSLNVSELEILTLSCAIVEAYKISGSLLYVNQYIEPGLQKEATPTYIPDGDTLNLIRRDPNCVAEAANALIEWNNNDGNRTTVRNPINNALNENSENATENAINALKEELQKAQEERQKYLESLGGTY
ncbi:MAG: hypothetical protein HFJ30_01470 [Clostridia bacterium]|nr:hypothetical protein [Clostridia bacterium]MCI9413211.1 hypothetical protein [Clostridia bacterium]